jgi:hypothetical protein
MVAFLAREVAEHRASLMCGRCRTEPATMPDWPLPLCRNCERVCPRCRRDGQIVRVRDGWLFHHEPDFTTTCPTASEENNMPETQSGEVTGIPSAVHYLQQMAVAHARHADNEALVASLTRMKVGPGDVAAVQRAIAASAGAAELFTDAAASLDKNNAGVREAYGSNTDAADKQHQMAE